MGPKLNEAVAEKFDLIGVTPGKHNFAHFGEIDLCAIGITEARVLIKAGFPYLKEKAKTEKIKEK